MAMCGYIRTSREQEADRPGMNPETQRRDLLAAGVPERNIYADIDVSGLAGVATRNAGGRWTPSWSMATSWWWRHWTALVDDPWTSWARSTTL